MLTLRSISGAKGYGKRHLEANDYWDEKGKITGLWWGRGAAKLGLAGAVLTNDLELLGIGKNPVTGEKIRQRFSTAKIQADGSVSQPIQYQDAVFSAPKSVSILACLGDSRLLAGHDKAVLAALACCESLATTRVRAAGVNADRQTGNLVAAIYRHDSSRALDCNVHSHCVLSNLTWDRVEGKWKALKAKPIYDASQFLTEAYRNELAKHCLALGYEISSRRNGGFEITGISPPLLEKFSQRSKQRDSAVADFARKHKRQASKAEIAELVRASRADKLVEISSADVRAQQRARLTPAEALEIENLVKLAQSGGSSSKAGGAGAKECLDFAIAHLFERLSVVRDFEILKEALKHGRGGLELRELQAAFEQMVKAGELLRHGNEITTKACLSREREIIACVNSGMNKFERFGGKLINFDPGAGLNEQQKVAITQVLNCRDEFLFLSGAAGVGKTTVLEQLHKALKLAGQQVVALAPSQAALAELQARGFRDAFTLQRLLLDDKAKASLTGKILILDESGMVSAQQMADFLAVSRAAGARVIFAGDTQQLNSVDAGDALRVLEQYSFMKTISISKIERQQAAAYREAMENLRENTLKGFHLLEKMEAILEVLPENRAEVVALTYENESRKLNSKGQKQSVLIVAATHQEIDLITAKIRSRKRERGELGQGKEVDHLKALHWTEAQRGYAENFQAGQFLVFHRKTAQFDKDSVLEVLGVKEKNKILVRGGDGKEFLLNPNQLKKAFSVCEKKKMEVCAGDKLLLQVNSNKNGVRFTNSELVNVEKVSEKGIHLADGRVLPGSYHRFTMGYAITAHKSQGQTVDSVIVSGEGMRSKPLFYVACTRGRERLRIITSNKEALKDALGNSGERKSALELLRNDSNDWDFSQDSFNQHAEIDTSRITSILDQYAERTLSLQGWELTAKK
jgi:conjugative relaxase-like TrwC/TraI family protein